MIDSIWDDETVPEDEYSGSNDVQRTILLHALSHKHRKELEEHHKWTNQIIEDMQNWTIDLE